MVSLRFLLLALLVVISTGGRVLAGEEGNFLINTDGRRIAYYVTPGAPNERQPLIVQKLDQYHSGRKKCCSPWFWPEKSYFPNVETLSQMGQSQVRTITPGYHTMPLFDVKISHSKFLWVQVLGIAEKLALGAYYVYMLDRDDGLKEAAIRGLIINGSILAYEMGLTLFHACWRDHNKELPHVSEKIFKKKNKQKYSWWSIGGHVVSSIYGAVSSAITSDRRNSIPMATSVVFNLAMAGVKLLPWFNKRRAKCGRY